MSPRTLLVTCFAATVAFSAAAPAFAQTQTPTSTPTPASIEAAAVSTPPTLWLGNQSLVVGLGQRHDLSPASALRHDEPTLGLGWKLTAQTTVTLESDARALRSHDAWLASDQHRVGLSFRTTSASRDVKSLMTVQLSGQSVLQLRPRSSGLRVTYRATF